VAYRIMLLAGDGASFPDICRQVAAIEFMHDVNEAYLHRAPIKAALEWAKRCISQRKPTGNGAAAEGNSCGLPPVNSNLRKGNKNA
jgi:hypothetical protein